MTINISLIETDFDTSEQTFDGTCLWCIHIWSGPRVAVACHRAKNQTKKSFMMLVWWDWITQKVWNWEWCKHKILEIPNIPLIEILEDGTRALSGQAIEIPKFLPKRG